MAEENKGGQQLLRKSKLARRSLLYSSQVYNSIFLGVADENLAWAGFDTFAVGGVRGGGSGGYISFLGDLRLGVRKI